MKPYVVDIEFKDGTSASFPEVEDFLVGYNYFYLRCPTGETYSVSIKRIQIVYRSKPGEERFKITLKDPKKRRIKYASPSPVVATLTPVPVVTTEAGPATSDTENGAA